MAKRHQVLDSICHTEEQIRQLRGVHDAFTDIVEKCLQPLDIGLALMTLPEKSIVIRCEDPKVPLERAVRLVQQVEKDFQSWLKATDKGVTTNCDSQAKRLNINTGIQCKVAAAPISTSGDNAGGILVIARRPDAHDFTRSDLKFLTSITANIAKIIQANYDDLTGLINRNEFEFLMEKALTDSGGESTTHCVLHINLDELQTVYESMGADAHDETIRQVAMQLERQMNEVGPVARIGEDEFGVLVENCPQDLGWFIGEDIRRSISGLDMIWNEQPIKLTASIGVAKLATDSETVESALAAAKIACIAAKDRGRDRVAMYQHRDAMLLNGQHRMQVIHSIQQALRDDNFILYCQAIKPLRTRERIPHFEILVRGIDENMEPVLPGKFMSHAEHARLMPEIDRWVVKHALQELSKFLAGEEKIEGLFAINLSGQSLCDDSFTDFVNRELARTKVPPEYICFEITETAAILNVARAKQFMAKLRKKGCRFALDDFGAGLSSFAYLKTLPVDFLKIDGQFIRGILDDPVSSAIVSAISQMGHAMDLRTIAEFVENSDTESLLKRLGVDYAQGYGVAKPLPFSDQLDALAKGGNKSTRKTMRKSGRRQPA